MEANVNAVYCGVSIDTSRIAEIVQVNSADMDCEVEAVNNYCAIRKSFDPLNIMNPGKLF